MVQLCEKPVSEGVCKHYVTAMHVYATELACQHNFCRSYPRPGQASREMLASSSCSGWTRAVLSYTELLRPKTVSLVSWRCYRCDLPA